MRARGRIRPALAIVLVVAGAILVGFLAGWLRPAGAPAPSNQPSSGATLPGIGTPGAGTFPVSPATGLPSPAGASPDPALTASPGSARRGGDGFAWSFTLPDDPALGRSVVMGSEIWTAGDGDRLRGVFAGPLDPGPGAVSLESAAQRLRGELAMIPGGTGVSEPEAVRLAAGESLRVRLQVGALAFTGFAIVHGGKAYRLIVVGYPDAIVNEVAMSLVFR